MEDLDAAVALLYAQAPADFVKARAALVKELKAAKRKEDAAMVAALRRPTRQAWAVGEALRRAPDAAAAFFSAISGLAEPGADLRSRTSDLRSATAALVSVVEAVDAGEANAALLAVAADPAATEALQLGRLAQVPAAGGFGGLTLVPAPEAGPDEQPGPRPNEQAGGEQAVSVSEADEAAERERREAQARARAGRLAGLEAERDDARAAEEVLAQRVQAAQAAVDEAKADLDQATAALAEARAVTAAARERLQAAAEEPG